MYLQDEQINIISGRIKTSGIRDAKLHADILDHICCYIEEHLQDNAEFESLLASALQLLAPGGLQELEEEKYFLFHLHKQLNMKRALFFSGFAATFLISTGITFKMLHWPGANILLMCGFFSLMVNASFILINAAKRSLPAAHRVRIFTGVIAAFLIATGSMFKILHYPGANILGVLGMALLNFVFLPFFFYHLYQSQQGRLEGKA